MKNKYLKKILFISIVNSIFITTSCGTLAGSNTIQDQEKKITELESSLENVKSDLNNVMQDNENTKKLMASMQNDLQSQQEDIETQKKNISIIKRGLRSGIFEDLPDGNVNSTIKTNETMLPDFVNGRTGFSENTAPFINPKEDTQDPVGPKELLAYAEIKIRKSQFKDGLIKLDELRKKFPNFDDNGRSFLLSAEAWLKLKEYNNVIPEIRNFYLKYPTSADLAYAKLLEGQATEGIGSFEKAATLYNEVISLSPQSSLAQAARDGMLRMRDQK